MSKKHKPADEQTVGQLQDLGYQDGVKHENGERPLLVCDVDEVVLHLVDPFVQVLDERGFYLKSHSFRLTGNVFHKQTHEEATQDDVWAGLDQLFKEQDKRQALVDGAVAALNEISSSIDILFLTNMPHDYGDLRKEHLANHGLHHPLVTNTGSKVPAIQIIQRARSGRIGFIDDTPVNLEQVRDGLDGVDIFHFMANEDFRKMAGKIDKALISTGHWPSAARAISDTLSMI